LAESGPDGAGIGVVSEARRRRHSGDYIDGNAADFLSQQNPATVTTQTLSGGSSASQQRLAASAPWTGMTGVCP
jgi:hypothetical protein